MFNVAIDLPPHCYWNDIMSLHFPPGHHGFQGGVNMCTFSFVFSLVRERMPVVFFKQANLSLSEGDNIWKGQDALLEIINANATSTVPPALLATPLGFSISILTVMQHGTFDPLLPLFFSYVPSCWFICALSLSSHLSSFSITSYSPPGSARIDTAVCWLSAHSTHLLVCVSRLL